MFILLSMLLSIGSLYSQVMNAWPLPDYYHNLSKIQEEIRQMDAMYPDLVHWEILGTTYTDHLPLYAVKLSVNADKDRFDVPHILFVGQHHGEEIIGVEIVMNEMHKLLSLFGKDPEVTSILENNEVWFIPTVNPEGYNFVSRSFFPTRRKNNTDTNMNGILDLYLGGDGVDLNKSYDFNWDNDAGTDPEEYYYKGPFPASEAETIAMQNLFERERFSYAIQYHSSITGNFSERIYFAWNWNGNRSPDYQDMRNFVFQISRKLPRDYVTGYYRLLSGNTSPIGFARDYEYANYNTFAYDIECGGIYKDGISIVRPFKPKYDEILEKHFQALLELFRQSELHTFRGRILNQVGEPVVNASIIYPDRHSPYQRAVHTNPGGYFFRYIGNSDLSFRVNLKYDFLISSTTRTAEYTIPLKTEPGFADSKPEGVLFNKLPASIDLPEIRELQPDTRISLQILDGMDLVTKRNSTVYSGSAGNQTWMGIWKESETSSKRTLLFSKQPELRLLEFRNSLIHDNRMVDRMSQEYLFHTDRDTLLTWCREESDISSFWVNPHIAVGVKFNPTNRMNIKGIRIHGDLDGTLLNLAIIDLASGKQIWEQEVIAKGNEGVISVVLPQKISLPSSTMISVENLTNQAWKIKTETSIYPCSHLNYVRYDEWQKLVTNDLAIELITEN